MPVPPRTARETIALAAEKIRAAAKTIDAEDPRLMKGLTPGEWAHAGTVDELVQNTPFNVDDVAALACQHLSRSGLLDRVGGVPVRYRPIQRST